MDRRESRSQRNFVLIASWVLCSILFPLSSGSSQGLNRGNEGQPKGRFQAAAQNGVRDRYIVVLEDQFSSSSRPQGRHGPSVPEVASALARLHVGQVIQ